PEVPHRAGADHEVQERGGHAEVRTDERRAQKEERAGQQSAMDASPGRRPAKLSGHLPRGHPTRSSGELHAERPLLIGSDRGYALHGLTLAAAVQRGNTPQKGWKNGLARLVEVPCP